MTILDDAKKNLLYYCQRDAVDFDQTISVTPLHADQAIGNASNEFVLKKGLEWNIEAVYQGARGQAFTDRPSQWQGSLHDLFSLDLSSIPNRAIFVASMNATLRYMQRSLKTCHCRDDKPMLCGAEMTTFLLENHTAKHILLIGCQPAILKSLVEHYGVDHVRVLDLNCDTIGTSKHGVLIRDGSEPFDEHIDWCDLGLVTGSTIVNNTIDEIANRFQKRQTPLTYFGNTISGTAYLLSLPHLCPYGE